MEFVSNVLAYGGAVALLLGFVGIKVCAFADGIGRGLFSLLFPWLGFGTAMRRFPWIIWLWVGGIAALVLGMVLHQG